MTYDFMFSSMLDTRHDILTSYFLCLTHSSMKNIQISSGMKFPTFVFFSFQTKNVTIWSCHHLKNIIIFKWNEKCHHLTVSPFEIIYGFSYQFENVTIWICHHLKTFQTSHHIGMKAHFLFSQFFSDQAFIWWQMSPYECLVWKFSHLSPKNGFQMVTIRKVLP